MGRAQNGWRTARRRRRGGAAGRRALGLAGALALSIALGVTRAAGASPLGWSTVASPASLWLHTGAAGVPVPLEGQTLDVEPLPFVDPARWQPTLTELYLSVAPQVSALLPESLVSWIDDEAGTVPLPSFEVRIVTAGGSELARRAVDLFGICTRIGEGLASCGDGNAIVVGAQSSGLLWDGSALVIRAEWTLSPDVQAIFQQAADVQLSGGPDGLVFSADVVFAPVPEIPEPATALLLGAGVGAITLRARRGRP